MFNPGPVPVADPIKPKQMATTINIRKEYHAKWAYGPALCPLDFEMLMDYFNVPYTCWESEQVDYFDYEVPTEDFSRMIDSLKAMTDDQYQQALSFEESYWATERAALIEDFEYVYNQRDRNFCDDEVMFFSWF